MSRKSPTKVADVRKPAPDAVRSGAAPGDPSPVRDAVLPLPRAWRLHYGDELAGARIAYRLAGAEDAPVIAVMGGISAHRIVGGADGWWPEIVGPGLGIDTRKFCVLGIDYLGGRGESSAPQPGSKFPPLSSDDQAEALRHIVLQLGMKSLHAIVGASYGGMVALCFAARHAALLWSVEDSQKARMFPLRSVRGVWMTRACCSVVFTACSPEDSCGTPGPARRLRSAEAPPGPVL